MSEIENCITCGSPCRIVGHTTKSYEPLYAALEERLRIATEALEFYGNRNNYDEGILWTKDWEPDYEMGERARDALKRIEVEK